MYFVQVQLTSDLMWQPNWYRLLKHHISSNPLKKTLRPTEKGNYENLLLTEKVQGPD